MNNNKKSYYYRAGRLMVIVLICYCMANVIASLFFTDSMITNLLISAGLVSVASILLPAVLFTRNAAPPSFHMNKINLKQGLVSVSVAIGLFFFSTAINNIFDTLFSLTGADTSILGIEVPDLSNIWVFLLMSGLLCVIPAFSEEILFRGALLYSWRSLGRFKSSAITALLFALLHLALPSLPALFLVGLVLGLMAYDSRSVFPSIIVHFTYNFLGIIFMALASGIDTVTENVLWINIADICLYLVLGFIMLNRSYKTFKLMCDKQNEGAPEYGESVQTGDAFPDTAVIVCIAILFLFSLLVSMMMYIDIGSLV